jgi:hypothetical protein
VKVENFKIKECGKFFYKIDRREKLFAFDFLRIGLHKANIRHTPYIKENVQGLEEKDSRSLLKCTHC